MGSTIVENKKYRDETWDFRTADTKQYTHCFHAYPAMMIPQVAGRLLDEFSDKPQLLFDPYCGTGTSLVEANIRGINAIGTDINPLARLIAKVKTTVIPINKLDKWIEGFKQFIFSVKFGNKNCNYTPPDFKNIDYWFKPETKIALAIIKKYIETIEDKDIKDFFKVAFSETVRAVSLTRNSEFKLYRITEKQIEKFNPDVFGEILHRLVRNRNGMEQYQKIKLNNAQSIIYDFNTVETIPDFIKPQSVDIVITSPPYGDSRTTVAYGQFSRLANQWLGFEEQNQVDKRSMGGVRTKKLQKFDYPLLDNIIEQIAEKDIKRAFDVVSFYIDYQKSINNIARLVRPSGIVAYVVGNRRVKSVQIPTDEITREFFERNGFTHLRTIIRAIPNKRMPKKNSPSNIAGQIDNTMNYEYIVIMQKK